MALSRLQCITAFIFIILLFSVKDSFAQYDKYKALYIYNFTKRIDWPESNKEGDFIIGVLGKSEIVDHLKNFTLNKKVIDQEIVIVQSNDISDLQNAHLLFITGKYNNQINQIVNLLIDKPVLIITDQHNAKGDINFVETSKELQFQINPEQIRNKNLKVSQSLIKLGTEIKNGT